MSRMFTPIKTNMARNLKIDPLEKEIPTGNHHVEGPS